MYEFLLFVHVLSAFCLASTVVIYSAFALGAPASPRTTFIAERLWDVAGSGRCLRDLAGALRQRL